MPKTHDWKYYDERAKKLYPGFLDKKRAWVKRWKDKVRFLALIRVGIEKLKCNKCGLDLIKAIQEHHEIKFQKVKYRCDRCGADISETIKTSIEKLKCVRCGMNELNLLQINHKSLNGKLLKETGSGAWTFYRKIAHFQRKIDDLEILCFVCNWLHFIEKKYKLKYNIKYQITSFKRKSAKD